MRYAFIRDHDEEWPIKHTCRVLMVSTSGYYKWLRHQDGPGANPQGKLMEEIRRLYEKFNGIYGSPRIHEELKSLGYEVNHKCVERLMREMGLSARPPKRFVRTTDSDHDGPIAPDLLQQDFSAEGPDQKWVGDITYIATDEGWLYLATVMDLYSRKIVGWSFSDSLERSIAIDALKMAIANRRPKAGLIFHSDRGCQYASHDYRELMQCHGIQASMSRKGCCYDNAAAESFFHSLKVEEVHRHYYRTRDQAQRAIFRYIEAFYNPIRRHSTLGYVSPVQFESRSA